MKNTGTYFLFFLSSFLLVFCNWMVLAYLPLYLKSVAISDGKIGFIVGIFSLSSVLMVLPAGLVSDLVSPRKMALAASCAFIAYGAGLFCFQSPGWLAAAAFLGGSSHSILNIILYSLFLKVIGTTERGKKIAFFQMGMYLGFGSGPLVGGVIVQYLSFDALFLFAVAISTLLLGATWRLPDSSPVRFNLLDYGVDLGNRRVILLLVIVFVYATHFGVEQTSFSLLMQENIGLTGERIGLVFFILGVWMALLAPLAGHGFDRSRNVVVLLVAGILASSFFQVMTAYAMTFAGIVTIRVLHTMGDTLVILSLGVLNAELFPEKRMGGNVGVVHVTRTFGVFLGNIFSGYLNTFFTYDRAFIINGIFILVFTLFLMGQMRKRFGMTRVT